MVLTTPSSHEDPETGRFHHSGEKAAGVINGGSSFRLIWIPTLAAAQAFLPGRNLRLAGWSLQQLQITRPHCKPSQPAS